MEDFKECGCCRFIFPNLEIHHIDKNRSNNKKENLIEVCKSCHMAIHYRVGKSRIRKFKYCDNDTILNIYNLRKKLHKALYGSYKNMPKDIINKRIKNVIYFNKIMDNIIKSPATTIVI